MPPLNRSDAASFLLVFFAALTVASLFVFAGDKPLLSLLFDSQGYMAAAEALRKLDWQVMSSRAVAYIVSGFDEGQRQALLSIAGPARELSRTGPVLPAILTLAYTLAGKAALPANWTVGALWMLCLHAATVAFIWLAARLSWGRTTALLAALAAATYPGFVVNSARILSEIPATLIVSMAICLVAYLLRLCDGQSALSCGAKLAAGLITGCFVALIGLARPPLIFLPLLLAPIICAARPAGKRLKLDLFFLVAALSAGALVFAPWALTNKVLTGKPSISIDRNGAWNLYVGTSTELNGFDTLPCQYVSHPERFRRTIGEIANQRLGELRTGASAMLALALRKPARLVSGPWNDFSIDYFGASQLWQSWWHQVLLCLAGLGALWLLPRSRPSSMSAALPAALVTMVAYHLICCIFITMYRYMVTAMPAVILLAAAGSVWTVQRLPRKQALLLLASCLILPLATANLAQAASWQSGLVAGMIADVGQPLTVWLSSAAILVAVALWFALAALATRPAKAIALAWALLGTATAITATAWAQERAAQAECALSIPPAPGQLTIELPGTAGLAKRHFLVADLAATASEQTRTLIQALQVTTDVAGQTCQPFRPLLALDTSQRENLLYLAACAYSSGSDIYNYRQWFVAELAGETAPQKIILSRSGSNSALHLLSDPVSPSAQSVSTPSLRRFSWTKGLFVSDPGDIRISERQPVQTSRSGILPRLYLLSVPLAPGAAMTNAAYTQTLDGGKLGRHGQLLIRQSVTLPRSTAPAPAMLVRLTGKLSGQSGQSGPYGIVLVENLTSATGSRQEFSPLAPQTWPSGSQFLVEDIVPLAVPDHRELQSLDVLAVGCRWWDALAYGRYKGAGTGSLSDMRLTVSPCQTFNLDDPNWTATRCRPHGL